MVFDVELTHPAADRYIARVLLWPDVVVEAPSREEALEQIGEAIRQRRDAGIEIVQVIVDDPVGASATSPWRKHAGTFPEDELYEQMLDEVRRYRRELDTEPSK
jgi:hypothetical protein